VEGARPTGRPKKTWERDCEKRLSGTWIEQGGCHGMSYVIHKMDEADKGRLMTTIGACEWVNISSGTGSHRLSLTKSREP